MSISSRDEGPASHRLLMDRNYHLQRHIYDASRKYYLLGRDSLLDGLAPPKGARVLEIGCGTARNLIGVARRFPDARLFGLDISQQMLMTAWKSARREGIDGRVRLVRDDACSFDPVKTFGEAAFERIYFSYTLSMIPDWQGALSHSASLLAPGGELHVVDFGGCERLPDLFRRCLWAWLRHFHVSPRLELGQELQMLAQRHDGRAVVESIHGGYAVTCTLKASQIS